MWDLIFKAGVLSTSAMYYLQIIVVYIFKNLILLFRNKMQNLRNEPERRRLHLSWGGKDWIRLPTGRDQIPEQTSGGELQ